MIKQQNQSVKASVYKKRRKKEKTLVDLRITSALTVNWSADLHGLNLVLFLDGFITQADLFDMTSSYLALFSFLFF